MGRSISFVAGGDVETLITITENDDGTLKFDLEVLGGASIAALSAFYFDLDGVDASEPGFSVEGDNIRKSAFDEGGVDTLGGDTNIKGSVTDGAGDFDVGIAFKPPADPASNKTSFTLGHNNGNGGLSLDALNLADFGLRFKPAEGTSGGTTSAAKVGASATGVARNDDLALDEGTTAGDDLLANDTTVDGAGNSLGIRISAVAVGSQELHFDEDARTFSARILDELGRELGTLTVTEDGEAEFVADGEASLALNDGETAGFIATYTSVSASGGRATAEFDITVNGQGNPVPETPNFAVTALSGDWQFAGIDANLGGSVSVAEANALMTDGFALDAPAPNGIANADLFNQPDRINVTFTDGPALVDTFNFIASRSFNDATPIEISGTDANTGDTLVLASTTAGAVGIVPLGAGLVDAYEIDLVDALVSDIEIFIGGNQIAFHEMAFNTDLSPLLMMS